MHKYRFLGDRHMTRRRAADERERTLHRLGRSVVAVLGYAQTAEPAGVCVDDADADLRTRGQSEFIRCLFSEGADIFAHRTDIVADASVLI